MVYFNNIQPTEHYLKEHQKDVPWDEVVNVIFSTKNPRKKNNNFEIETDYYYVLFFIKNNTLFVVNAKRK